MTHLKLNLAVCLLASLSLIGMTVQAGSPDALSPSRENICDPLKAENVTKGLYGLCVAFCEAQDITSETAPITAAELARLETATPSGRLLVNYNKKKTATDPAMPCVVVEEPCPCFTAAELEAVDGVLPDPVRTSPHFLGFCSGSTAGNYALDRISEVDNTQAMPQPDTYYRTINDAYVSFNVSQLPVRRGQVNTNPLIVHHQV